MRQLLTEPLPLRNDARQYGEGDETEEGVLMTDYEREAEQRHMLLLVESAQRAGCTEAEIAELVEEATEADADLAA